MIDNQKKIAILLSTYNGSKFLREQLESLESQIYRDFCVFIRDDGSTDNTVDICREYVELYPKRFYIIDSTEGNLGAKNSFSWLAEHISSELYMFCDQDDIWLPNKIKNTYETYLASPTIDDRRPSLVYTDLIVISENRDIISNSLIEMAGRSKNLTFENAVLSTTTLGCTTLFNHALKNLAFPCPPPARMHDSWLTVVALIAGHVVFCDKVNILYRQHSQNQYGIKRRGLLYYLKNIAQMILSNKGYKYTWAIINEVLFAIETLGYQDRYRKFYNVMKNGNVFSRLKFMFSTKLLRRRYLVFHPKIMVAMLWRR